MKKKHKETETDECSCKVPESARQCKRRRRKWRRESDRGRAGVAEAGLHGWVVLWGKTRQCLTVIHRRGRGTEVFEGSEDLFSNYWVGVSDSQIHGGGATSYYKPGVLVCRVAHGIVSDGLCDRGLKYLYSRRVLPCFPCPFIPYLSQEVKFTSTPPFPLPWAGKMRPRCADKNDQCLHGARGHFCDSQGRPFSMKTSIYLCKGARRP
eukprot:765563-Hanusia_phi.AAC.2